jgi:hypothetical protein
MQPFFQRLPSLRPADKAMAVHFGHFPGDGTPGQSFQSPPTYAGLSPNVTRPVAPMPARPGSGGPRLLTEEVRRPSLAPVARPRDLTGPSANRSRAARSPHSRRKRRVQLRRSPLSRCEWPRPKCLSGRRPGHNLRAKRSIAYQPGRSLAATPGRGVRPTP